MPGIDSLGNGGSVALGTGGTGSSGKEGREGILGNGGNAGIDGILGIGKSGNVHLLCVIY